MKQCPQCKSAYPDQLLKFCGRDGAELVDLTEEAVIFTSLPISPSETVLLFGEQFAPPSGAGAFQTRVQVPISGAMVDAEQLAKMMLSAMVLACEQAGSIQLQPGSSGRTLVSAGPVNISWPQWSLEDRLCGRLSQGGTPQLDKLVHELWQRNFGRNHAAAWIHARTLVLQGLAARNLISAPPNFSIVQVAPALADLPPEQTTEPLKRLFDKTATERAPIWASLQRDIRDGVRERVRR